MNSSDLYVLETALAWLQAGTAVALVTVVETWGSAPRPVGSLLAVAEDGRFVGSVSGGCIEEHLVERIDRTFPDKPYVTSYGVSADEARRFGLPCGGTMAVLVEPVQEGASIAGCVEEIRQRRRVCRTLDMDSGRATVALATGESRFSYDGKTLSNVLGTNWRLVIVGAGHLARYLARMALMLDFSVYVSDPRLEYRAQWDVPGAVLLEGMPDDALLALGMDACTAIVTTAHDPKVDDMALLEALKSEAFYVGALGSPRTSAKRRIRLGLFDLAPAQIDRLQAPAGIPIGSHTPAEIALSMLAEVVARRSALIAAQRAPQPAAAGGCVS
ncbi:MAG: XdhC family protein [Sterolibacterium sp.]|nr:XdhC family protein [Sterolibacterium sp.]MBP9800406.1 XdhC family protein [Sterolibacterium sp.]